LIDKNENVFIEIKLISQQINNCYKSFNEMIKIFVVT